MRSPDIDRPMQAFARYTDPGYMLDPLQRYVDEQIDTTLTLTGCRVINSRYKTYRKPSSWSKSTLSVCYRLTATESVDDVLLYAKVYLEGRSLDAWLQLRAPGCAADPVHLPALDMLVWRFPADPAMPQLAVLADPQQIRRRLPFEQLPAAFNRVQKIATVSAQMVKYAPEKCCTTRFLLHRWGDAGSPLTLYGKTYSDDQGRASHARLRHFWRSTTELRVAQPLGYDETTRTAWQLGVDGLPLLNVIDRGNYHHYVRQLARGLAAVHDGGLDSPVGVTPADRLTEFNKKIDKLRRACPAASGSLDVLAAPVRELDKRGLTTPASPRTIYGDFHIEQMLARDGEVYFFDLDSFALGDPEQDLAEFIVALWFYRVDSALIRLIAAALLDAYRASARWPVHAERIYWHAQIEYLDRAYRLYLGQQPGWADALQRSLAEHAALKTWIPGLCSDSSSPRHP